MTIALSLGEPRSHFLHLLSHHEPVVYLEPRPDGLLVADDHQGIRAADFAGPSLDVLLEAVDPESRKRITQLHDDLLLPIERSADTQDSEAYAEAFERVFSCVDALEDELTSKRFLFGHSPSEADWFLYAILLRFDPVYAPLYKLNAQRIGPMPQLGAYLRDLYQRDPAAGVVDFTAIKRHYFWQDTTANHRRILPRGGEPNLALPHDRDRFETIDLRALGTEEQASTTRAKGGFVRGVSGHRHWITDDGSSGFPPESGRYHIYIANNCPWCHRVALTRALKELEDVISMDVLYYRRDPERGWQFNPEEPGCTEDTLYGASFIQELYTRVGSKETSVPILFDKKTETIVSNESAEIIRMLDRAFRTSGPELCPPELETEIDRINAWTYTDINNGAYKAGFTHQQVAYDIAFEKFFAALERLEALLSDGRSFLLGEQLTEADVRLFPTIFRFDPVYFTRFRLNRAMVRDHPHLSAWHDRMLELPAVARASNLDHCKKGYFGRTGNDLVPLGPRPQ